MVWIGAGIVILVVKRSLHGQSGEYANEDRLPHALGDAGVGNLAYLLVVELEEGAIATRRHDQDVIGQWRGVGLQESQTLQIKDAARSIDSRLDEFPVFVHLNGHRPLVRNVEVLVDGDALSLLVRFDFHVGSNVMIKELARQATDAVKHTPQGFLVLGEFDVSLVEQETHHARHVHVETNKAPNEHVDGQVSRATETGPKGTSHDTIDNETNVGRGEAEAHHEEIGKDAREHKAKGGQVLVDGQGGIDNNHLLSE